MTDPPPELAPQPVSDQAKWSSVDHGKGNSKAQPKGVGACGVLLYGLASIIWFAIVSTENLNSSYPLLVSMTFVFVTVGATTLFHEPLPWQKVLGIAIILGGIITVSTAK